ncbi:MAG TPA: DNA polymerase III subunit gamma/tau [Candidatus Binataceae bacterium]|nr:DNA polymerase III subunit gamma/tau [Candidatus Binataceae bacterium]
MAATLSSSHLVLARKWRPERFAELVGQEHVTRTLAKALSGGRIAHAFLFTGIRGVGKTTAARILARCLNCHSGPTADPCGECPACVEIRAGSSLDVVEIDGATYRKIDDARAIIENLSYRPARDRFKIYIIDEAHQLTDQAFNALLKTLEEPPAHVKFILATTEPQKMPETILSRLQRYDFRRIPFATIFDRLKQLASFEQAESDEAALRLIAREAGGSMRDAERMLETALASLDGKVAEGDVAGILGVASRTRVIALAEAIINKDAASALRTVRELHERGANLEALGRDLLETLRNLAIAKLPDSNGVQSPLVDLPDQETAELRRLASAPSGRDLMRLFKLMADAQEQIIRSPYPDLLLEMAVIRMASLAQVVDADELLKAIGNARTGAIVPNGGGSSTPSSEIPPQIPPKPGTASAPPTSTSSRATSTLESTAEAETLVTGATPILAEARLAATAGRQIRVEGEVKADAPRKNIAGPQDLPELRVFIRDRRAALAGFMEQGAILQLSDDRLTVTPRNDIYVRYLSDNRNVISNLASEMYGRKIRVEMAAMAATVAGSSAIGLSNGTGAANLESKAGQGELDKAADTANDAAPDDPGTKGGPNGATGFQPKPPGSFKAAFAAAKDSVVANDDINAKPSALAQAELKQAVIADPVAQRLFTEFQARLVEVRPLPAGQPVNFGGDGAGQLAKR